MDQVLSKIIASEKISHSYMISATGTIRDHELINNFIVAILCTEAGKPCRTCSSCIMFERK